MCVITSKMINNTEASQTPITIHILKAHDDSYSRIRRERKYKDKDNDKDDDKDTAYAHVKINHMPTSY